MSLGTAETLWLLFFLVIGGCIGSFLNVVVYRLPHGQSIVHPASRCPKCGHAIRHRHNVPVLGWFLLGGRCYDCHEPIAARYPSVEFISAVSIGAIGLLEVGQFAVNVPIASLTSGWLSGQIPSHWAIVLYHIALLSGLLAAALIEYDGFALPRGFVAWVTIIGAFAPMLFGELLPISAFSRLLDQFHGRPGIIVLFNSWIGIIFGASLGALAGPATGEGRSGLAGRVTGMITLGWVGMFLGWQAAAVVGACAAVLFTISVMYRLGFKLLARVSFAGCVWLCTLVWIALWSYIADRWPHLSRAADWRIMGICGGIVLFAAVFAWLFRGRGA